MCRLLPLIIEHTIDERSPLIGHTYESLMAVRALRLRCSASFMAVCRTEHWTLLVPMLKPPVFLVRWTWV